MVILRRRLVCLVALVIFVLCSGVQAGDDDVMKSAPLVAGAARSLEQLWQTETEAAQNELQRFLHGYYRGDAHSLPAHPPWHLPNHADPTPAPVAPSTLSPVAEPVADQEPPSAAPQTQPVATFAPHTEQPTPLGVTCLKGRTPEQYLLDELLEISTVNVLLDPLQPQGMAFNFILGDTTVRDNVCTYSTIAQRYGLGRCRSCPRREIPIS